MDLQSTTYPLGQPDLFVHFCSLFTVREQPIIVNTMLVVPQGFEPQLDGPKPPVLPLY